MDSSPAGPGGATATQCQRPNTAFTIQIVLWDVSLNIEASSWTSENRLAARRSERRRVDSLDSRSCPDADEVFSARFHCFHFTANQTVTDNQQRKVTTSKTLSTMAASVDISHEKSSSLLVQLAVLESDLFSWDMTA